MSLASTLLKPPSVVTDEIPRGDGRIVLVIPAFLSGDWATAGLRGFLSQIGYRVETAGIALNFGPTTQLIRKLDRTLLRLAASQGGPVDVIGQSLGGVLARDLAERRPDCVRHLDHALQSDPRADHDAARTGRAIARRFL